MSIRLTIATPEDTGRVPYPLTEGEREFFLRVVWGPDQAEHPNDVPTYRAANLNHLMRAIWHRARETP